ncbi:MAG: hypothetical protein IT289_06755 [Oligoflexia bacterium]|nr:hypothetical protein [Oligoflexia bacterium]
MKVSYWLVAACWLDLFWMVMPSYSKSPFVPWVEIGVFVGFAGGFGYIVTKFLSKVPVQPQKDPRVHEALHLHS